MIGLDTNIVVRYVLQDDAAQLAAVDALFRTLSPDRPALVTLVTVAELAWVLDGAGYRRAEISDVVTALLSVRELVVERADSVAKAVRQFRQGNADLADCLIAVQCQTLGCDATFTFDRKAAKSAGMTLLEA